MPTGTGETEVLHEELRVTYGGPGVESGTMDVRELAPALLALSALFQQANRELHPTIPDVALKVEATSRGSFHIDLLLQLPRVVEVLSNDTSTALANLIAFVSLPSGVIAYLIKRRKEPDAPSLVLENGEVEIKWADGTTVRYRAEVMRLAESTNVRREIQAVVKPLESGECDEVVLSRPGATEPVRITVEDLPAFSATANDEEPIDSPLVLMTLTVVAPSFDRKKWRVSDGGNSYWVTIADESFQQSIEAGESFAKGDYLRCMVRFDQFETDTGLRLERTVEQVMEHRKKPAPPDTLPGF